MDYDANGSLGPWTVNNVAHRPLRQKKPRPVLKQLRPAPRSEIHGAEETRVESTKISGESSQSTDHTASGGETCENSCLCQERATVSGKITAEAADQTNSILQERMICMRNKQFKLWYSKIYRL